jgi:hypothetical protein
VAGCGADLLINICLTILGFVTPAPGDSSVFVTIASMQLWSTDEREEERFRSIEADHCSK